MTTPLRRLALALLALWVASVAYVTLTPTSYTPPFTVGTFFCVWCGELDGSDILRNWILFVPGGLLAASALGPRRAVALAVAFTGFIEVVQIGVPGRDPAFQDLFFNSLGATVGATVMSRGLAPWGRLSLGASAALAWLAPLVLLVPATTRNALYGQWTPRFSARPHYEGRILEAFVGGQFVHSGRVDDKARLDSAIVERKAIRLVLTAGPQLPRLAPVFQIVDSARQGIVELHALGPDLILRGRDPARMLKLDQPDTRWPGAMDGVVVGDTVTVVVERGRDSVCMSVDDRERCDLAPSLAEGWGHVLNLEGPALWLRRMMSAFWALGLGGMLGLAARSWRSALAFAGPLVLVGHVGSVISPDVRPSPVYAAVFVLGALVGALLQRPVVSVWRRLRPA